MTREEMILNNQNLIYFVLKKMNLYDKRDDLFDVGLLGLIKGVDSFDPQKGALSTYLYRCIYTALLMEIRKKRPITISFDTPIDSTETITLEDILKDDYDFTEEFVKQEKIEQIYLALDKLSDKERDIIVKSYGLFNTKRYKQKELAEIYNFSQSYVSRVVKKAEKNIKKEVVMS